MLWPVTSHTAEIPHDSGSQSLCVPPHHVISCSFHNFPHTHTLTCLYDEETLHCLLHAFLSVSLFVSCAVFPLFYSALLVALAVCCALLLLISGSAGTSRVVSCSEAERQQCSVSVHLLSLPPRVILIDLRSKGDIEIHCQTHSLFYSRSFPLSFTIR